MVIAVGDGARIAAALPELDAMLDAAAGDARARARLQARRRSGSPQPRHLPEHATPPGLRHVAEAHGLRGRAVPPRRRTRSTPSSCAPLREAGAAGATSLRGIWGYHGDHAPHGDSFWQLRRRVPVVTVIVDTPERIRDWFAIVDELTDETGLVTSEIVPAFRTTGHELRHGGLRLARRPN